MSQYILDTDCVTLLQRKNPQVVRRAKAIGGFNIFVTTVTLQEQLEGRLAVINKASSKKPEKLAIAHKELGRTLLYFCKENLLYFDDEAYKYYQSLRQQKIRIGSQDLKIASIALANNAILVTRNYRDFCKVPNLHIEDWTV